jgi:GAF domain-containing protein
LCVIDKVPRDLRPEQKQALLILAHHVVSQLELRRRTQEVGTVRQENVRLKDELERARTELAAARRDLAQRKADPAPNGRPAARHGRK